MYPPNRMGIVLIASMLAACEPPPEIVQTLDPTITIAYPDLNGDELALQCEPNPAYDCTAAEGNPYIEVMSLLVVVDVDNIQLQDPYADGVVDEEGQGHWHAAIGALAGYQPSSERSTLIVANSADLQLGVTRLTVTLQDNTHDDLPGLPADSLEFTLVPSPTDCSALLADYCPSL